MERPFAPRSLRCKGRRLCRYAGTFTDERPGNDSRDVERRSPGKRPEFGTTVNSAAPRLSIALPVLDAEPWLAECLDSVLAQSERSFEVLAVDDGSSDASAAILDDYRRRDGRIRVLATSDAARGIVPALNLALGEARGEYLVRMDA